MVDMHIIQIHSFAPNPVTSLSGYEPTTEYWVNAINLANAMLVASGGHGQDAKMLRKGANITIVNEIFPGETHTAVEWAEFTMAINHILWFIHDVDQNKGLEYTEPVMEALQNLYYEWRDKALDTLKGDDLSEYLRITD